MPAISSGDLRVDLLDPAADAAKLGPRFAWGGFIWQVHDRRAGPLLTGPEWPHPTPSPFNGQGLPESFRHRTRDGRPHTWDGERGVALGAGELAVRDGAVVVVRPCVWETTLESCAARFRTRQEVAGWDYALERTVELFGRELRSSTRLTNHGARPLELEWFAHPFFPPGPEGLADVEVPAGSRLAENPGFSLEGTRLRQKRPFVGAEDGHLDYLLLPAGEPLRCRVAHPRIGGVAFSTSFAPSECLVWGNGNTFSIEPYRTLEVAPGRSESWDLRYDFGASSGT